MDLEYLTVADGTRLAVRRWGGGDGTGYVLVHGLASNLETWGEVADVLHAAGHPVVAYDQRSHGRSGQVATGHDMETALDDLDAVIAWSGFEAPVVAGQSWGANLVLAHAARRSGAGAVVCVDGAVVDLRSQFESWEACAELLRPPSPSVGLDAIASYMRAQYPEWSDRGIRAQLANLVEGDDGIARNRLPLDAHMQLLRTIWDHPPADLHPQITIPAMFILASTGDAPWMVAKHAATHSLNGAEVRWVEGHHDLHVHRPAVVASLLRDRDWR